MSGTGADDEKKLRTLALEDVPDLSVTFYLQIAEILREGNLLDDLLWRGD